MCIRDRDDELTFLSPGQFAEDSPTEEHVDIEETEEPDSWSFHTDDLMINFDSMGEDGESFGAYFDLIPDARHEWTCLLYTSRCV